MANNRINRINEDIQRALAELFLSVKDPRLSGGLISIVRTDTTNDLRYCKVYVSVLNKDSGKETLKGLKSASGWFRRELGSALSLRYTPELIFELDNSIEHGAHIAKLLGEIETTEQEGSGK